MRYITDWEEARRIDKDCKNKWRGEWLHEEDTVNRKYSLWLKKIDKSGTAWCHLCSKRLLYKSNGKKSFLVHAIDPLHFERLSAQAHTATLPTAVPVLAGLSKSDRITDFKIRTCAFLAEHCLPFSLAPALIDFAKKLAEDPKVLDSLSMNRSTAAYTLTHGVARGFKEELLKSLRTTFFSLNVDEATNNADNKVVNALVRFFDELIM
ncbi:hypothetical protein BaRGS_00024146 [Batillaria attramentaria]|uniref:Transposase n=1 Tax=Batillaria attramentaria TaxID=370345 RepID=A0ABD0KC07_9CAEN